MTFTVWDTNGKNIAGFDGIIIYPNGFERTLVSIIEAKNLSNGNTVAQNQINEKMSMFVLPLLLH